MTEVDTSISTPELDLPRPSSARITPSVPLPLPAVVADGCHDCEPTPGAGATEPPTPDASSTQPPSITANAAADSAPSTDDVVERELPRPSAQMALSESQSLPTAVAAFRDDCDTPRAVVVVTVAAAGCYDCDPTPDADGTTTPPPIMADAAYSAPPTDVLERDLPRPSPRMVLPGPRQPTAVTAAGRGDRDPPTPVAVAVVAAGCDDRDPAPVVASSSPGTETEAVVTDEVEMHWFAKFWLNFVVYFVVYMVAYYSIYGIVWVVIWLFGAMGDLFDG